MDIERRIRDEIARLPTEVQALIREVRDLNDEPFLTVGDHVIDIFNYMKDDTFVILSYSAAFLTYTMKVKHLAEFILWRLLEGGLITGSLTIQDPVVVKEDDV